MLEAPHIAAYSHYQSQHLFQRLLRMLESNSDSSRHEFNAPRQTFEFLAHDRERGLNEHLRLLQPGLPEFIQSRCQFSAPLAFVISRVTPGQRAQVFDQHVTIGEAAGADALGDAAGHDLLGAARADAEQKFDGAAVDPGSGKSAQLGNDAIQSPVPGRFRRHSNDSEDSMRSYGIAQNLNSGMNDKIYYHALNCSARLDFQATRKLSLCLLQNCMFYINTLRLQQVLAQPESTNKLTPYLKPFHRNTMEVSLSGTTSESIGLFWSLRVVIVTFSELRLPLAFTTVESARIA